MGIKNIISKFIWPSQIAEDRPIMSYYGGNTVWYGDRFSDGSKFKRGIPNSGNPIIFSNSVRKINAKNAYYNSPYGRSIIRRKVDTEVGPGVVFRSKPIVSVLGISEEIARKKATEITTRFGLYMTSKTCTSSGTMNGYQFQRHMSLAQHKDGEYFVIFNRNNIHGKRQVSRLTVQPIDCLNVKGTGGVTSLGGYNDIDTDMGIIRDEYCREIGYNILIKQRMSDGTFIEKEKEVLSEVNGFIRMVHGFIQEEINQLRGIADLSPINQELSQVLDLDISIVQKAVNQSGMVFAVESEGDDASINPFEDLMVGQGSVALDVENPTSDNKSKDSFGNEFTFKEMPEAQIQNPGGVMIYGLPPNQKINNLSNTAPMPGYGEFIENFISYLSAATDMPIEMVRMKFGENYSASRAVLVLAYRIARIYREELVSDLLKPWLEAWLECEIADNRIELPGFNDPILREAWLNGDWIGEPMPEIDPVKQSVANKNNLSIHATTPDRIALETNGSDGETNRRENEKQFADMAIPYWENKNIGIDNKPSDNKPSDNKSVNNNQNKNRGKNA
jgi:capsid protein